MKRKEREAKKKIGNEKKKKLKEERKKLKLQIASHVDNGCIIDGDESMWEVGKVDSTCK